RVAFNPARHEAPALEVARRSRMLRLPYTSRTRQSAASPNEPCDLADLTRCLGVDAEFGSDASERRQRRTRQSRGPSMLGECWLDQLPRSCFRVKRLTRGGEICFRPLAGKLCHPRRENVRASSTRS